MYQYLPCVAHHPPQEEASKFKFLLQWFFVPAQKHKWKPILRPKRWNVVNNRYFAMDDDLHSLSYVAKTKSVLCVLICMICVRRHGDATATTRRRHGDATATTRRILVIIVKKLCTNHCEHTIIKAPQKKNAWCSTISFILYFGCTYVFWHGNTHASFSKKENNIFSAIVPWPEWDYTIHFHGHIFSFSRKIFC